MYFNCVKGNMPSSMTERKIFMIETNIIIKSCSFCPIIMSEFLSKGGCYRVF